MTEKQIANVKKRRKYYMDKIHKECKDEMPDDLDAYSITSIITTLTEALNKATENHEELLTLLDEVPDEINEQLEAVQALQKNKLIELRKKLDEIMGRSSTRKISLNQTLSNEEQVTLLKKKLSKQITKLTSLLRHDYLNSSSFRLQERIHRIEKEETALENIVDDIQHYEELPQNDTLLVNQLQIEVIDVVGDLKQIIDKANESNYDNQQKILPIKLPNLEIPKFNGEYNKWEPYAQSIKSLILQNRSMDDITKMRYLLMSLEGDAAQLASAYTATAEDLPSLWETLTIKYENKRLRVEEQLKKLINMKPMIKEESTMLKNMNNTLRETINLLKNVPQIWPMTLIQIQISKFDGTTMEKWHEFMGDDKEYITLDKFERFLTTREMILEQKEKIKPDRKMNENTVQKPKKYVCYYCKREHSIYECKEFQTLTVENRSKFVKNLPLCSRCLSKNHASKDCKGKNTCDTCGKDNHHTLLHFEKKQTHVIEKNELETINNSEGENEDEHENIFKALSMIGSRDVLLPTAKVVVYNKLGHKLHFKALIDPGSQVSIITTSAAQLINTSLKTTSTQIIGISGEHRNTAKFETEFEIHSIYNNNFKHLVHAAVLKKITTVNPDQNIDYKQWKHLGDLKLADPRCIDPANIDILLGADVYPEILENNIVKGPKETPMAIKTKLGYIILGPTGSISHTPQQTLKIQIDHLEQDVKRFWEQEEEIFEEQYWNQEEIMCEQHYIENTIREISGKYEVTLPFKPSDRTNLGNSKNKAVMCFFSLEKKFRTNQLYKDDYVKVIEEYIKLGHMRKISNDELKSADQLYYLPHHSVFKETSTTTKTRVVFNASAKSTNGRSLNDNLLNGPIIQNDLATTLLKFRMKKIAITADIEKMYRAINLNKNDQIFHCIVWRKSEDEPIETYVLTTVTFGTKPAPFLAIRTLHQLANDEKLNFPKATDVTKEDFYVDDLLTGEDSEEKACDLVKEIQALMTTAHFNIRKWASNVPEILSDISEENKEIKTSINSEENHTIKTLGIYWDTNSDEFKFKVKLLDIESKDLTKRKLLSEIARIYDPHGWMAPLIVKCKILLKAVWKSKTDWDDKLPDQIAEEYDKLRRTLLVLQDIHIPRWVQSIGGVQQTLVGFCDASEKAYGAVIYLHTTDGINANTSLLLAKTRVTPMKTTTIPRLELNSAKILSKLMKKVDKYLQANTKKIYLSDSMIALHWIKKEPYQWKTFVANRVSAIQTESDVKNWYHVSSEENPADKASRGLLPEELKNCTLWWQGPEWLKSPTNEWHLKSTVEVTDPNLEKRSSSKITAVTKKVQTTPTDPNFSFLYKFGTLLKLIRVVAMIRRPLMVIRNKNQKFHMNFTSAEELEIALMRCVRATQKEAFTKEYECLSKKEVIPKSSQIIKLTPFMDKDDVLRVRGRLYYLEGTLNEKQPMILPQHHHVTNLIIDDAHKELMHAGAQSVLYHTRQKFWIINGRETIRKRLQTCMKCARYRHKRGEQMMGNLPIARVQFTRAFEKVGIDYAGPIAMKTSKLRQAPTSKAYIALFICMVTKAIHLELVSDMTTESFLAALRRFVSRRGLCTDIYSDRGTNFVGAKNELPEMLQLCAENEKENWLNTLAKMHINWHMNPPYTPHFGGLWESGIKSTKYHLIRIMQNAKFTYEELSTVLTQIEACLNSRPISEQSNDIDDYSALTPGHFLIGSSLKAVPERNMVDIRSSTLTRWQHVQQRVQNFWKQWRMEFFGRLQQRQKWQKEVKYNVGNLVLIIDEQKPPSLWNLGRIITIHPGMDDLTRVVTIKTANGEMQRSITKICMLPNEEENVV